MYEIEKLKNDVLTTSERVSALSAKYNDVRFTAKAAELASVKEEIKTAVSENITASAKYAVLTWSNEYEATGLSDDDLARAIKKKVIAERTFAYTGCKVNDKTGSSAETMEGKFNLLEVWEWLGYESFKPSLDVLGLRLTLATADLTRAEDLSVVKSCYKLNELAKQKMQADEGIGINPLSKSQTVNAMQALLDEILFVPCESDPTKNLYRVNNRHWNTLLLSVTAGNKKAKYGGIKILNSRSIEMFFADALCAIVNGRNASLTYGTAKEATPPATAEKSASTGEPEIIGTSEEASDKPDATEGSAENPEPKAKKTRKPAKTKEA
ncbi:MAG: hypothetical protein NC084_06320 [Bacteroides sp.]|nr:hypothetical protein [Eubacterium sp.]MCM1418160.1 hypothetical protein [Roseburia sp.]MCM1462315.1 hypothetical protein [Bacteroides sp.]